MVQPTVMNVCFRWLDKARICGANPPERRLCGCLTVSLFNGRICLQIRAVSRQRNRKSLIVGYSRLSEVFTQTGPGHHEGNSGVSVKPHCQSVLRPSRALVRNFWLLLFPRQKLLAQRACEASRAKQHLADFAPAKPCF